MSSLLFSSALRGLDFNPRGYGEVLEQFKQKLFDYLLLAVIFAILLYGKLFPGKETNTPSSRESD